MQSNSESMLNYVHATLQWIDLQTPGILKLISFASSESFSPLLLAVTSPLLLAVTSPLLLAVTSPLLLAVTSHFHFIAAGNKTTEFVAKYTVLLTMRAGNVSSQKQLS